MTLERGPHRKSLGGKFKDAKASLRMFFGQKRLTDNHANRSRKVLRQFPEKLTFAETQERTPHAIDGNRQDRSTPASSDQFKSLAQLHETAIARQTALGEDTDNLATLERFG